jgi:hypothetical protein
MSEARSSMRQCQHDAFGDLEPRADWPTKLRVRKVTSSRVSITRMVALVARRKGDVALAPIFCIRLGASSREAAFASHQRHHVRFWFDSPEEAGGMRLYRFHVIDGEQNAGPLAMIRVPNAITNLGPPMS